MKVFIADDSILIRNIVKELLSTDPSVTVVGEAANGADAVRRALELDPDIVIMDIDMPIMNGLEATARIAGASTVPVLVFTHNADPELPFRALRNGAVDFLLKPDFADLNKPDYVGRFIARLKVLSARRSGAAPRPIRDGAPDDPAAARETAAHGVDARWTGTADAGKDAGRDIGHLGSPVTGADIDEFRAFMSDLPDSALMVVGASTGGPQAVCRLLSSLPSPFSLPITLVQHIETGFDKGYADWLAEESGHRVLLAREGLAPEAGVVHVAPTDLHLRLSRAGYLLDDGPKVLNQKPSVDVLFRSAAELHGPRVLGILLTGMGTDGAEGCVAIRAGGGYTVVQDESSSLIFGMPKAAIARGAASIVLPLDKIAPFAAAVAGKNDGR